MKKLVWVAAITLALGFSAPVLAADGGALYKSKCSACHGATAKGGPMAPGLVGTDFIGGDAGAIKDTIMNGRAGGAKKYPKFALSMPPFKVSDAEADAIVAYLKGL